MPKDHIVLSALHPGMWIQYRTNKQWHYGQVKSWHQKHDMTMVTIAEYPSQHQITRPGLHLFAMSREQIPLRTQPGVSTIRRHMLQIIDQWITQGIIRVDPVPRTRGWSLGVRPYAWSQWTQYFPEEGPSHAIYFLRGCLKRLLP
uniref:Uncharacterized protein n=1 Tax=Sulfobacillus thermotolerans TaxID=338644 RepID=G5CJ24_9FIRM|nr:hypothetical protein [Sulfobacillus thermotolerans]